MTAAINQEVLVTDRITGAVRKSTLVRKVMVTATTTTNARAILNVETTTVLGETVLGETTTAAINHKQGTYWSVRHPDVTRCSTLGSTERTYRLNYIQV